MNTEVGPEPDTVQPRPPPDGGRPNDAQTTSIRISRQGKIRVFVQKALEILQVNPEEPLVLFSSPSDVSVSTIPKLVSVVEIIKREYLKGSLAGLHQFNQLLFEEQVDVPVDGNSRPNALVLALEGSSHPKRKLAPSMKITLCAKALPEMQKGRVTYQTPSVRKLTKSAKAKLRKRAKKQTESRDP
ncbi:hypothetical protein ID866_5765 [Astraeus odoratus]|nr:hypothetical protein ID866_5765 [Astraeus odoratus]